MFLYILIVFLNTDPGYVTACGHTQANIHSCYNNCIIHLFGACIYSVLHVYCFAKSVLLW